ncbi:MAG TPA: hypothetical protein VGF30_06795 [Bacteroidia bacterium]
MTPEEVIKLKHLLVAQAWVKPAYELRYENFVKTYVEYSLAEVVTALAELYGEGLFSQVSGMLVVHLTGEGMEAARMGYTKYVRVRAERQNQLKKQVKLNTRMNWWILVISILSLLVGVVALFK